MCYRVPQAVLLATFQEQTRQYQVFVQQPHVCALVFARNSKRGGYTGIWQDIPKTGPFESETFLAANALPGPGSKIVCDILAKGKKQLEKVFILMKDSPFSRIPGYNY